MSITGPPRILFSRNREKEDKGNTQMCSIDRTEFSLNWGRTFPIILLDPLISPTQHPTPTPNPASLQTQAAHSRKWVTKPARLGWVSRYLHHMAILNGFKSRTGNWGLAVTSEQMTEDRKKMFPAILVSGNAAYHQISSHCRGPIQYILRGIEDSEEQ